jgi:hypothetical protein
MFKTERGSCRGAREEGTGEEGRKPGLHEIIVFMVEKVTKRRHVPMLQTAENSAISSTRKDH